MRRAAKDERFAAMAWFELAHAEERLGYPARAAVALRRAVQLRPEWCVARLRLGGLLLRLSKLDVATEQARAVLTEDPNSPEAHRLYGTILYHRRRFAEAADEFAAWVKHAPNDATAHLSLGRAFLMRGRRPASSKAVKCAVNLDPSLVRGHLLLAKLALASNNLWAAQTHLKNAIEDRPESSTLRALLADVLLCRGQYDAAVAAARAALVRDPGGHAASLVIAKCHLARGEWSRASTILALLFKRRPQWKELSALREELVAKRGNAENGRDAESARLAHRHHNVTIRGSGTREKADGLPGLAFPAGGGAGTAAATSALFWQAPAAHLNLIDHLLIIRALILRDLKLKYRNNGIGFLLEFLRPLVIDVTHYFFFAYVPRAIPNNIPIEIFVLAGFSVWFVYSGVYQAAYSAGRRPGPVIQIPRGHANASPAREVGMGPHIQYSLLLHVCTVAYSLWRRHQHT